MVMQKYYWAFLGTFVAAFLLGIVGQSLMGINAVDISGASVPMDYNAQVCIYKTPWLGDHYGAREIVECSHNLLYNNGQNMTRDALGVGGNMGPIVNISLCNATAGCATPVAGASEAFTAYTTCGLVAGTAGTYGVVPTSAGNWSIFKTYTSSCDGVIINSTRLSNHSGSVFAGNTFTLVTLQTNDQLTVNWTISVT